MAPTTQQTTSLSKAQGIEYTIYARGQDSAKAEKQDTKTEMTDALAAAEELFKSGKYLKVEVRQRYFDKKQNREIDTVLKAFEGRKKLEINAAMMFVLALLCGGLAFGATYFLSR